MRISVAGAAGSGCSLVAEMAQAEIRIWVRGQSGREITAASRLHVLSGPWRDRILNVVGLPVPDATGGRLEILCRLGGEK
ncbi:head-tail adaptor of cryptic prophage CP-933P [Escherichia coli]|nr:head-tail adaptor of cryptic prophage CP-933P [Escherichia coli]